MMNILITGSDGFIGSHLVKRFKDTLVYGSEINLVCVDKSPKRKDTLRMNVASKRFLKYFRGSEFDFIFHFGSPCSILQFKKNPGYCVDNTLTSFRNILRVAEKNNAKLIYPSSGNIYGSSDHPLCETDKSRPSNLYGICKSWCESMANYPSTTAIGLRIFCGYGPGEEMKGYLGSVLYQFLCKMMKGKSPVIWGDGTQMRDFVYIDDLVNGILASAVLEGIPFVNLASGSSTSYNELVRIINVVLGSDISPVYVEKPENYIEKTFANVELMKIALGVKPRSLAEGIRQFSSYLDFTRA